MGRFLDLSYKSLFHHGEELCGDQVIISRLEDSKIMILTDGMGHGVRANILATLTGKILLTLFSNQVPIEEAVETIAKTLPLSSVNNAAYCTFSLMQIFDDGSAYIVEYDNPKAILIRNHELCEIPFKERQISDKSIREAHMQIEIGDAYLFMSDGALYCGGDQIINYAWDREAIAKYALKCEKKSRAASHLASDLAKACLELYLDKPTDDTTIAVCRVKEEHRVNIMTGAPSLKEYDRRAVLDFIDAEGMKIVCGGTTSEIVARELNTDVETDLSTLDEEIPPTYILKGVDLATEGRVTLFYVNQLLQRYLEDDVDPEIFFELEKHNGASMIASCLIDNCTRVVFFVGTLTDPEAGSIKIALDMTNRQQLVEDLAETLRKLGKDVEIIAY